MRTKQKLAVPSPVQSQFPQSQQAFAALQQYGLPIQQLPPQQQPPQQHLPQLATGQQQPNLANLISTLDGPALQKVLSAMQANPQQPGLPQASPTGPQNPDLQALLGTIAKQQAAGGAPQTPITPQSAGFPTAGAYQQQQAAYAGYGGAGYPPQQQQGGYPPQAQQQQQFPVGGAGQNNVQAMLDQITRGGGGGWKQ